jgi:cytochrome c-type biogenesis protein CcmH/NrfG
MSVRFCSQCGTKTVPDARFCASCGMALPGSGKMTSAQSSAAASTSWRMQLPGLTVLASYLLIGTGLWFSVLRTQPFPTVGGSATTDGPPTGGGQQLPQNHPPVTLPEEVRKRITEFANQAKEKPQDVGVWKSLAEMQFRASQIEASYRSAALESFKHVLELSPNDLDALKGIGNIYYDFEEHAKAIDYYKRYLAQKPDDAGVRTDLGTMYLYSNNFDQAISEYQTVIAKDPQFFQAYFNLGVAYNEKGEKGKSLEALNKAKSLTTDQGVRDRIDQFLAQLSAPVSPSVAQAPPTTPSSSPSPQVAQVHVETSLSPFQQAVEKVLRGANIMGERINRIEWTSPTEARVLLQNFPMSGMPPQVRAGLVGRLQTKILEAREAAGVGTAAKIELIDLDSQQVMETLNS